MPAASTRASSSAVRSARHALVVLFLALVLQPSAVRADDSLTLRRSETLSTEPPHPSESAEPAGAPLRLSPSYELMPLGRSTGLQPGEELAEVLLQVDINQQGLDESTL